MRHIKENNYIFTDKAYDAYQQIDDQMLDSFWESYENEMYASIDPIIMYYMIQSWFVDHDCQYHLPDLKLPGVHEHVQQLIKKNEPHMIKIFHKPSQVFYRGVNYPVDYDLERAERIFSTYERQVDDSSVFGARWWHLHGLVEMVITHQVGLRS